MSERNGDRARFHKDRKRKMLRRQRIKVLAMTLRKRTDEHAGAPAASDAAADSSGRSSADE